MGVAENNLDCSILSLGGKVDENVYIYIRKSHLPKKETVLIICEMHAKFTPKDVFYVYIYILYVNSSISDGAK